MNQTLIACMYMIGGVFAFCSMAVAGRLLSGEFDTFEIMAYRSIIGVMIVLIVGRLAGALHEISARDLGTHGLRNVVHFAAQNLWFAALATIPLAQVFALEFTSPIWVMVMAALFLGEALTRVRVICAALGFIGILFVARPGAQEFDIGLVFAAVAAVGFAVSVIVTKHLTKTHSVISILFWLTTMQTVFGFVCAGIDGDIAWPSAEGWILLVIVGFAGVIAHYCLTKALSLAPANIIVPIDFARLPLIALVGALFFSEPLDIWVFIGGILIFAANYINTAAEMRQSKATTVPH